MRCWGAKESVVTAKRWMVSAFCVWLTMLSLALVCPVQAQTGLGSLGPKASQRDDLAPPMLQDRIRERGIRSVAVWRYPIRADGTEGEGAQILFMEYDRSGNVALRTQFGEDGLGLSTPVYSYDKEGRIAAAEYAPGQLAGISRITFCYDDEGRLVESVSYLQDGGRGPTVSYKYDRTGRPVQVRTATADGGILSTLAMEYGPDGKVKRVVLRGPSGTTTLSTEILAYDASGKPSEQVTTDGEGRVVARTTSTFDEKGRPTRVTAYNGEDRVVSVLSCSYDERGNVTQIVQAYPTARLRTRTTLRYDSDGCLLEQTRYNKLDEPVEIMRYVYDHYHDQ